MATDFALAKNSRQAVKQLTQPETQHCRRILLVDDAAGAAQLLARLLGMLGHQVAIAHDGQSAIDTALHTQPHVIFLDMKLPDMSGCDVARALREKGELADSLFVALTGYSDEATRTAADEAGFDEFVVKPAAIETLEALLQHPKLATNAVV